MKIYFIYENELVEELKIHKIIRQVYVMNV